MDLTSIIEQMAVLFLTLAIGYIANKLKVMSPASDRAISKLVLSITMPCTILSSVMGNKIEMSDSEVFYFLALSTIFFAIALLIAFLFIKIRRGNKADNGLICYLTAFGNVAFMGFPVAFAVFGQASVFYVALLNIPFSVLAFSVGILMIAGRGGKIGLKKLFLNPSLIAAVVAVMIFFLNFRTPTIIATTASLIGGMTTPAAMLVIGSLLASLPMKSVFSEARLYLVAGLKLVVIPLITWLIFKQFVTEPLMLGVLVLLSGMPAATSAAMISMEYGGNDKLASKGVFITTLFSVVTIPVLIYFFV